MVLRHHLDIWGSWLGRQREAPRIPPAANRRHAGSFELRRSGYVTGYGVGYVAGYPRHVTALQSWKLTKEGSRPRVHTTSKLRFCPVVQAELCSAVLLFPERVTFTFFTGFGGADTKSMCAVLEPSSDVVRISR